MSLSIRRLSRPAMLAACSAMMVSVAGCGLSVGEQGVKGAKGDTPAKYVICSAGETNCFVAARFKDLDACERHKKWADMLCDSISTPGLMTCRTPPEPSIGNAYCVP